MHQLFIPVFCILQLVSAQAQCFFPNATALNTYNIGGSVVDEYVPCNAESTAESMCCRTNSTERPDTCRPDGLCETYGGGGVSRDSCTDALWKSEDCVALCISGTGRIHQAFYPWDDADDGVADTLGGRPWGQMNSPITMCDDGSYCCGNNVSWVNHGVSGPDCCAARNGVFLDHGRPTFTSPNAKASIPSASEAARTSGPSSTPAKGTPTRVMVAGVIGGLAGSILMILGIRLVMIKRKMRAEIAVKDSSVLKQSSLIDYVNLGWGPCQAPTYAGEYTRQELWGQNVERPQLEGTQRLEKG